METYLLEINMISAQGLKPLSAGNKKHCPNPMQAYAIAWIDPAFKLRTSVDSVNRENPCWNDKFLFRVTDDFLSSETAAVNIEIYSAGDYLKEKDPLIGTVRFLVNNQLSTVVASPATGVGFGSASFTAVQVRRPSGRFHGALTSAPWLSLPLFLATKHSYSCLNTTMDALISLNNRPQRNSIITK